MALFGIGKKKDGETNTPCHCCKTPETADISEICCTETAKSICCIKVLGAGCKSCHEQYENVRKAVTEMGLDIEVEYITDMERVMTYGVMSMPAIAVNEKIASTGKVLKTADVVKLLKKYGS